MKTKVSGIGDLRWFWLSYLSPFVELLAPSDILIIWLFSVLTLNVPYEGHSRNACYTLNSF